MSVQRNNEPLISLGVFELLSGLSRIHLPNEKDNPLLTTECKLTVKNICDYIVNQCNKVHWVFLVGVKGVEPF